MNRLYFAILFISQSFCHGATLVFSPATLPGGGRVETIWQESGFLVESGHMASHSASASSSVGGFWPSNGTDHLSFSNSFFGSGPTQITSILGSEFNAISVDLAEYSHIFQTPKDVTFIGTTISNVQHVVTFTTDGVITGPDTILDFEAFIFPASFSSLVRLEIPTGTFAMDNLTLVAVPEPSSVFLLGLGILGLTACRRRIT